MLLVSGLWFGFIINQTLAGQPACSITGGSDVLCHGNSTVWSAPEGMTGYFWTGPDGFSASSKDITINTAGDYTLQVTDPYGSSSCQKHLAVYQELSPGLINTTTRQFCTGGTTAIGGTTAPYGPASGGSGTFTYTWQMQEGCTGSWTDIPGTNSTSFTPPAPLFTTCYRRKVTDQVCGNEAFTDAKRFEIYPDPVSQEINPLPSSHVVCSGVPLSATFTGGSGGFPGGTTDVYEFSTDGGTTWNAYSPGINIPTAGLSGSSLIQIRTRRISTGVNGCNYGSYAITSWSINPTPSTSSIYHN